MYLHRKLSFRKYYLTKMSNMYDQSRLVSCHTICQALGSEGSWSLTSGMILEDHASFFFADVDRTIIWFFVWFALCGPKIFNTKWVGKVLRYLLAYLRLKTAWWLMTLLYFQSVLGLIGCYNWISFYSKFIFFLKFKTIAKKVLKEGKTSDLYH